jgi:hypothetical protein
LRRRELDEAPGLKGDKAKSQQFEMAASVNTMV